MKEKSSGRCSCPKSFAHDDEGPAIRIPRAIAIQHDERLTDVELTFLLQDQEGTTATYKARCPRCNEGEIVATLPLNADGSLPEDPAVPGFCLDCEERLDAILGTQDSRRRAPGRTTGPP